MKNVFIVMLALLVFASCTQPLPQEESITIDMGITLPEGTRSAITDLTNPVVTYTLEKDQKLYLRAQQIPLQISNGTFSLKIKLLTGAAYKFTSFDVYEGSTCVYVLNKDNTKNQTGFTVDNTGIISPAPATLYLKYLVGDGYASTDPASGTFGIATDYDEGLAPNLTFKVTVPSSTTVRAYYYSSSGWNSGTTLNNNDVYDMDRGTLFNPTIEGDGIPAGNDLFRLEVSSSTTGKNYTLYFSSADYNKKNIQLDLLTLN